MSRNPGIGKPWLMKWKEDVYPDDFVIVNGKKMRPPKYYDTLLEENFCWAELCAIKEERERRAQDFLHDNTDERLAVREEVQRLKQKTLRREL